MTGGTGWLWATTTDNRLWRRLGLQYEINWQEIGHANNVVGMTFANGNLFPASPPAPSGKLFAATSDNRLWARDPVPSDVNWQDIGHANNVRAMAFGNGKLFAATSDNRLWARDPVLSDVNWQDIGHANNVVGMTRFLA